MVPLGMKPTPMIPTPPTGEYTTDDVRKASQKYASELQEFFDSLPTPKKLGVARITRGEEYLNDWKTSPSPEPPHEDASINRLDVRPDANSGPQDS